MGPIDGTEPSRTNLLGYAIERAEFDDQGNEIERYWLRGIKRFKNKDKGLPPGAPVPTSEHPIQSFHWADYTAHRGTRYRYRIVPVFGTVKNPKLDDAAAVAIDVTTEIEGDQPADPGDDHVRHDVFFNRDVTGQPMPSRAGRQQPARPAPASQPDRCRSSAGRLRPA
ncbi:MAG TPA: hypothetical protein VGD94_05130 [Vicinamibacterales bacterium]